MSALEEVDTGWRRRYGAIIWPWRNVQPAADELWRGRRREPDLVGEVGLLSAVRY